MDLGQLIKDINKINPASVFVPSPNADGNMAKVDVISTGSLILDKALGVGGVPRGGITEIYGKESSGKTTIALSIIAQAQKKGLWAFYIDFEHALDLDYMVNGLGIDPEKIVISQPDTGEDAFKVMEDIINSEYSDKLGVIVVDSIAAIQTTYEKTSTIDSNHIGQTARLINKLNRRIIPMAARKNIAVIYINQLRANISAAGYGNPMTTSGGNSTKYTAMVRIEVSVTGKLEKGQEQFGIVSTMTIRKNKLAPPLIKAEVGIVFGKGVYRANEVVTILEKSGKIAKKGSWYALKDTGEVLGQGVDNAYNNNKERLESMLQENL